MSDMRTTRFAMVPRWIVALGPIAYGTWLGLVLHADGDDRCWPSQSTIAENAGISVSAVQRGLRQLIDAGAVTKSPGRHSCTYTLHHDDPALGRSVGPTEAGHSVRGTDGHSVRGTDKLDPGELEQTPNGVCESEVPPRSDVEEVVAALAAHVKTVTGREARVTEAWRRPVRLMLDGPGKSPPEWTLDQLLFVIAWLDGPSRDAQFWSPNVLCPAKLREQMDKLVGAIRRERQAATQPARDVESRIAAIRAGTRTEVSPLLVAAARAGRAAS